MRIQYRSRRDGTGEDKMKKAVEHALMVIGVLTLIQYAFKVAIGVYLVSNGLIR